MEPSAAVPVSFTFEVFTVIDEAFLDFSLFRILSANFLINFGIFLRGMRYGHPHFKIDLVHARQKSWPMDLQNYFALKASYSHQALYLDESILS